jgi:hypothetical protein
MSFFDDIKAKVWTDEDAKPTEPEAKPAAKTTPVPYRPQPISPQIPYTTHTPATTLSASDTEGVNQLLETLKAKTDFASTPIGKSIAEHMEPLNIISDAQLSPAQKMQILQQLKAVLASEQTAFMASADAATKAEIDTRAKKIEDEAGRQADLQRQLAESQQTQATLGQEIIEQKTSISTMTNQFNTAFAARNIELDTQISHYNSILTPAQNA